jgi:hypothetical protein
MGGRSSNSPGVAQWRCGPWADSHSRPLAWRRPHVLATHNLDAASAGWRISARSTLWTVKIGGLLSLYAFSS